MRHIETTLLAALAARVDPAALAWLDAARATAASGTLEQLLQASAAAAARVGRQPLGLSEPHFERWTEDDAVRALLLASRHTTRMGDDFVSDALACFEQGDAREQQSWLRAVSLWPEAASFLPTVIDACRTNILPLFESIACDNPYPAAHFPDRNFNQMVLKALFNSVPLARVVGLRSRLNADLSRMARDYAAERSAAGRSIPPDIGLAMLEEHATKESR